MSSLCISCNSCYVGLASNCCQLYSMACFLVSVLVGSRVIHKGGLLAHDYGCGGMLITIAYILGSHWYWMLCPGVEIAWERFRERNGKLTHPHTTG